MQSLPLSSLGSGCYLIHCDFHHGQKPLLFSWTAVLTASSWLLLCLFSLVLWPSIWLHVEADSLLFLCALAHAGPLVCNFPLSSLLPTFSWVPCTKSAWNPFIRNLFDFWACPLRLWLTIRFQTWDKWLRCLFNTSELFNTNLFGFPTDNRQKPRSSKRQRLCLAWGEKEPAVWARNR